MKTPAKHEYSESTGVKVSTPIAAPQSHYERIHAGSSYNYPPFYTEIEDNIRDRIQQLLEEAQRDGKTIPITEYPQPEPGCFFTTQSRQCIVITYFIAIQTKKDELVAALIENGLVTTETTDAEGRTPLLAAIEVGNIRTVQQLMDFDANVNAYGMTTGSPRAPHEFNRWEQIKTYRTPLHLAAEIGNLTIVKLLMETYGADDSLIAPDGELALRLAARNGHREVVDYLPSRRGGGFKRWKKKHQKAVRRVKKAAGKIRSFLLFTLYDLPRFFLWIVPTQVIAEPFFRRAKWLIKNRKHLPHIMLASLKRTWLRLNAFCRYVARKTRDTITHLPNAMKLALAWAWSGLKNAGDAVLHIVERFFAFVHTALTAIAYFFRRITLKDVWNGFITLLRAVIIEGPKKMWKWLCKVEDVLEKVFETLWGECLGETLWWIIKLLIRFVFMVPKAILDILVAIGGSIDKGCEEVMIWLNPKR